MQVESRRPFAQGVYLSLNKESTMSTLQQLLDQKAALDKQIETTRRQEHSDAIAQVKSLMDQHGLTVADLGLRGSKSSSSVRKGGKVAAKYRNSSTGETWSGRGLQPKWLKAALQNGRKIEEFSV
jgi:DNA-binding protein H-NS